MVDDCPVMEQAHKIQALTKELKDRNKDPMCAAQQVCGWSYYFQVTTLLRGLCYDSKIQEIGVHD
jgi:hypothetical protein